MLAEFHFLRPEWLWGLPVVAVLTVLLARQQLAAAHFLQFPEQICPSDAPAY